MQKRTVLIGLSIIALCLLVAFPVCRGRLISGKLAEAIEQKNSDLVKNLLDKGANPNAKDKEGYPLLNFAIFKGNKEITQLLLAKGANIEKKCDVIADSELDARGLPLTVRGMTALNLALEKKDPELMELLLAQGANPNKKISIEQTPLLRFLFKKPTNVLEALLTKKPKDYHCELSLLHIAMRPDIRTDPRIVKLLLEYGADVDAKGGDFDSTPLHWAIMPDYDNKCPDPEIIKMLLEYGADANAEEKLGHRPLQVTILNQCPEVAKLLLNYGADVNMRMGHGSTLLQIAVVFGNTGMVELLLDYGIDADVVNDRGETALDMAVKRGCVDIAEILRKHGARTGAELNATQQH